MKFTRGSAVALRAPARRPYRVIDDFREKALRPKGGVVTSLTVFVLPEHFHAWGFPPDDLGRPRPRTSLSCAHARRTGTLRPEGPGTTLHLVPARRGPRPRASPRGLPDWRAARHADPGGHQPGGPARLPQLRRRIRLPLSGQDDGVGAPVACHRDPGRHLRVQLHRAGASAHVRKLPPGLAAGAGRGVRAACPGVAGESRTRRADAGAGVGARLASLRASGGRARGRARGGVAVFRLQRGVVLLAHVLWRAAAGRGVSGRARGSNAVLGAGVDWPAGRVGRARTLPHGCGVRGADCAVAAAAGRGPGADRCAGRARWPAHGSRC